MRRAAIKPSMPSTTALSVPRKLWSLLGSDERRGAVLLLALMLIGMLFETLGAGMIVPVIALLTQNPGDYAGRFPALRPILELMGYPDKKALVAAGMFALIGVYSVKCLYLGCLALFQNRFAYRAQWRLSQRLYSAYLAQPYAFHLNRNSAQLIHNVIREVDVLFAYAVLPGIMLCAETMVVVGLSVLLLFVEPLGAIIVAGTFGLAGLAFYRVTAKSVENWGRARQYHEGRRLQHLQQGLGGVKEVKLLGRESEFLEQYRVDNVQSAHVAQFHQTLVQLPRLWLELLAVGGLATLVLAMLLQGRTLDAVLPTLGLFAAAGFRMLPSVNRILSSTQTLRYGLPAVSTLHSEFALLGPAKIESRREVVPFRRTIEFQSVTYAYTGKASPALSEISLCVRRGEFVGFIGSSGAGKSTLVDISLGLLSPTSGRLLVDGQDIGIDLRKWQDQVGYVPQSIFLIDDSLRRNIAFGLPDGAIDEASIWRALAGAQLAEFVKSLPEGLDTVVGERGVRISGGQRQRIGIARALYNDPAVLVLDEATSSLDNETERGVMEAVRALHGAKTIIVVAHRMSTVRQCDRLYRIESGRIVQEGMPDNILAAST